MSTYQAVGAVSSTLKQLLTSYLDTPSGVGPVPITVGLPPDDPEVINGPLVNLFLYRVCENATLQSQELPGQGSNGSYGHPPLALDLHYLLTTYGVTKNPAGNKFEDEIVAHWLLGSAMRILHDYAIITPTFEGPGGELILDPVLESAPERVKLTLQPISLEDLSKVWTALSRPFRVSAAYEVTVVQIETTLADSYGPPVGPGPIGGPHVTAMPGLAPLITGIHAAGRTDAFARAADTLVLEGAGLLSDETQVQIGGIAAIGQVTSARSDRMTVVVPDDPRLQPGILELSISHGLAMGSPPTLRPALTSNVVAFALVPRVDTVVSAGGNITVTGSRLLNTGVECLTLVQGQVVIGAAYTTSTPAQLVMPLPDGLDATQPARVFVRVNGVQSIDQVTL
ncbi:MAG: DUF4255 domain-containing protein [Trebonia sp.]